MRVFEAIYKKETIKRWDLLPYLHYFTYTELGMCFTPYEFSHKNIILRGGFYYKENYKKDHLVIFCHGIGGGHYSYMRSIASLVDLGYRVLAYDYPGCVLSDGKNNISMTESLSSLDTLLQNLKASMEYQNLKISVVGHSWGGFAASNILKYHPDLNAIVDISGFISIEALALNFCKGFLAILRRSVIDYEYRMNPKYARSSALDALQNAKCPCLIVHDEKDSMVEYALSFKVLEENVSNLNVRFLKTSKKDHQPHYTLESVALMKKVFHEAPKKDMQAKIEYFKDKDWVSMTNQDEYIWKEIDKTICRK